MVTLNKITKARTDETEGKNYIVGEFYGLSTDEKPEIFEENYVDNGSVFVEIDTQNIAFYDLENETWGGEDEQDDNEGDA